MNEKISQYLFNLQKKICHKLETKYECSFKQEKWNRQRGGGGLSAIVNNHEVLEKAGVNTSSVHGVLNEKEIILFKSMLNSKGIASINSFEDATFFATGLSIVIHPYSPFAPTVHCNYRYFELKTKSNNVAWFGGGADLTPSYYFTEDEDHFHSIYKKCCDRFDKELYPRFKKDCDQYFYLPHRKEFRGIGGIFFDYLNQPSLDYCYEFVVDCSQQFLPSYLPIVDQRIKSSFTDYEKKWQSIRRGRYVEFNLLHDKGTLFGFKTNGRTESILMSMPPQVSWDESFKIQKNSKENNLLNRLKNAQ